MPRTIIFLPFLILIAILFSSHYSLACDTTPIITIGSPTDNNDGTYDIVIDVCIGDGGSENGIVTSINNGINIVGFTPASLTGNNTATGAVTVGNLNYSYAGTAPTNMFVNENLGTCFNYTITVDAYPANSTITHTGVNSQHSGSCAISGGNVKNNTIPDSSQTYNCSSGTIYDSGGPGGNYNNSDLQEYVICSTDTCSPITITFSTFILENGYDFLYIYDNDSTVGARTTFTGTTSPGTVTSTNNSRCLSVRFVSDGSINEAGYAFTPSCNFVTLVETYNPFMCNGNFFTVHGTTYTQNGMYYDTLISKFGCDSITYSVNLFIDTAIAETYNEIRCNGDSFSVHGFTYTTTGTHYDTVFSSQGCDSIQIQVNLVVQNQSNETYNETVCAGNSFDIHGFSYSTEGNYKDTLVFINTGCDSITLDVTITIDSTQNEIHNKNLCTGETFTVHGFTYSNGGNYLDTLFTANGCDSITLMVNITEHSPSIENYFVNLCSGDSFNIHGFSYTASGAYYDTLFTSYGCDSITITSNLFVQSVITDTNNYTVCLGDSITIFGKKYSNAGTYNDTVFHSISGCDSLRYTINITTTNPINKVYTTKICDGNSYSVDGFSYNTNGTHYDTLFSTKGCDSLTIQVNLTVQSPIIESYNETICNGSNFSVHGFSYSTNGIHYDTLTTALGCDSIVFSVSITIQNTVNQLFNETICSGSMFSVHGFSYTSAGSHYDTLISSNGCDSIAFQVNLTLQNAISEIYNPTICSGSSFNIHGFNYTNGGIYLDTLFTTLGCDSITIQVNLSEQFAINTSYNVSICQNDSITIHGFTYSNSGVYNDTVKSSFNCDSIIFELNVSTQLSIQETHNIRICESDTLTLHGYNYTSTGTYSDTLFYSQTGCDSLTFSLNLIVDSATYEAHTVHHCDGSAFMLHGFTYNSNGLYNDTVFYQNSGCDSIIFSLNLTIENSSSQIYNSTICSGDTFNVHGFQYTTNGTHLDTLFTQNGCDSIQITVNILEQTPVTEIHNPIICPGSTFSIHGFNYNVTGSYFDTLFYTNTGCDSITFRINLLVQEPTIQNLTGIFCTGSSYSIHGFTYNNAGTFKDTVLNSAGCDSIQFEIIVSEQSPTSMTYNSTICDGDTFSIHGFNYFETGIFNDTLFTTVGCDSITLQTTILKKTTTVETYFDTICSGQTFSLHGITYTNSGTYYDTLFYSNVSCDSITYTLNLTVENTISESYNAIICSGDTFSIHGFNYTFGGIYRDTLFTQFGCDSITILVDINEQRPIYDQFNPTICEGSSFNIHGFVYTTEGVFNDTLFFASGCDSVIIQVNLTVEQPTIKPISASICFGKTFTSHGFTYSNEGFFRDTLLSNFGCDSLYLEVTITEINSEFQDLTQLICEGETYSIHGSTYNSMGIFTDTLKTILKGCDSIIYTLNLTIQPFDTLVVFDTICSNQNYDLPNGNSVNTTGTYNSILTSSNGCDSVIITHLWVNLLGNYTPLSDMRTCENITHLQVTIPSSNMVKYEWYSLNENNQKIKASTIPGFHGANSKTLSIPKNNGNYIETLIVEMTDACGNMYSDNIIINFYSPSQHLTNLGDTLLCLGGELIFNTNINGYNFEWDNDVLGATLYTNQTGIYTVNYIDNESGCNEKATYYANFYDCNDLCGLYAPNAFSPNSDGINDEFLIVNSCENKFSFYELTIFNRFGEVLFTSTNIANHWDGTLNGALLPDGGYGYLIQYKKAGSLIMERITGGVTIIK